MRCARPAICSAFLALTACGVVRPSESLPQCPTYDATIRPVLEARCGSCHSGDGYRIGLHTETVSRSDDGTPRVTGGDAQSPLLVAARGERAGHAAVGAEDLKVLEDWVVRCRAAPRAYAFHPRGWTTSTDAEQFHGQALRHSAYDFGACRQCHGEDLRGGAAKSDCNGCHVEGPQACNTCHGSQASPAPPRDLAGARSPSSPGVGAHRVHLEAAPTHRAFACTECHAEVKDDRHYRRSDIFTVRAALQLLATPGRKATFDRLTCMSAYCHAPSAFDTTQGVPVWNNPGALGCGSCHGNPPSTHASNARCETCHGALDPLTHVDGKVTLRNGAATCDACHSGPDAGQFVDLSGRSGIGAHDAHLRKMSCDACHLVPATLLAEGHLDSPPPAEVFVKDLGGLAWKLGAQPKWNAAAGTCSSVYCHGDAAPKWDGGSSQAVCGTCHGLPPVDGSLGHNPALGLGCPSCHAGAFSPDGGLSSRHLDGKITGQ